MSKKKIIALIGVVLGSTLLSLFVANKVAEVFFFDQLFYRKSDVYGYSKLGEWNALDTIDRNSKAINHRIADLIALTKPDQARVLGVSTEKNEKDIYKIALIGDSYVYGSGVKENERYGQVLEDKLNKIRPTKVYELGLPGDSIVDNYTKFLLAQNKIHPDLTILTLIDNDLTFGRLDVYPGEKEIYTQLHQNCPQPDFDKKITKPNLTWQEELTEYYYPSYSPEYSSRCILEQVAKLIPTDKLIVFGYSLPPSADQVPTSDIVGHEYSEIMGIYAGVFSKRDIPIISSSNLKDFIWKPVSPAEGHPSALTHQFYAQSLYQEITSNPIWKFKPSKN